MLAVDAIPSVSFGGYQLLERLAMGGMAEVFLARPEGQERFVAVKRILPNVAADDDFIAMFIDEAKIAGQLTHPNIAQILDIGKIGNSYFIAMEYVSGHDLRALWDRVRETAAPGEPRGLPIPVACHIVKKLAEGLDHAHRKRDSKGRPLGIIHRDVSPQNVLISYDGDLKIIDFGIAKAANRIVRTQTGILKGKFAYMAPEQARGEPIDHRSDVFAIGVVLYELLTGERAFKGDTDFVLLEKVRRVDVVPARELRPDLPRELERIMMKALGREAGDRYAWASVLAGDLDRFMSEQGLTTSRDELGAFVRRHFRSEHAEEIRRLALFGRRSDDAVGSGASVMRGGASARNAASRRMSREDASVETTEVGLAEQATAMAAERATVNLVADPPADTRNLKRRRASQEGRRPEPREPDGHEPSSPIPPSSSQALSTAVGPTVKSIETPPSTGSHRRPRPVVSSEPPPLQPVPDEVLAPAEEPPRPPADHVADDGWGDRQRAAPRSGVSSGFVVAACLLGAVLGAGLGVGVMLALRSPPPDTLIVVTPRQTEVRRGDVVLCAQTPCAVHLGRGRHDLLLQAPGAEAITRTVEVGEGAAVLDVMIERVAKAVRIETEPAGALVTVDDVPLPTPTPVLLPPTVVGKAVRLTLARDGFDHLTVERVVEGDGTWRFELPTPTTSWTITATPPDAHVDAGRVEGMGEVTVVAGRRPLSVDVVRPGCESVRFQVAGTGRARAERHVALECRPLTSRLMITSSRKPSAVKIDGVGVGRGADLDGYLLPPGTWTVTLSTRGRRDQTAVVETIAGQTTEARFR